MSQPMPITTDDLISIIRSNNFATMKLENELLTRPDVTWMKLADKKVKATAITCYMKTHPEANYREAKAKVEEYIRATAA